MTERWWKTWVLVSFILVSSAQAWAAAAGAALIADTWARYRTVKSEREESEILVVTAPQAAPFSRADAENLLRGGQPGTVHKRAVRHVLYSQDQHDKLHILFSLPPEDAGLGFLVWRQPDSAQDEMWLYMPGYHRVRRIPASSDQKLAGTDFLYEDVRNLTGERTDTFEYTTPATEQVAGRPTDVVIATPKSGTSTVYSRRKIWIDKEWLFPVQVEFYDGQGRLWKMLRNSDIHEAAPGVRRADLMEMRDVQRNGATVMLVTKRAVGIDIPAQVFTQDYLVHPGGD
jgi:hypothetical protein